VVRVTRPQLNLGSKSSAFGGKRQTDTVERSNSPVEHCSSSMVRGVQFTSYYSNQSVPCIFDQVAERGGRQRPSAFPQSQRIRFLKTVQITVYLYYRPHCTKYAPCTDGCKHTVKKLLQKIEGTAPTLPFLTVS
jgi:hypothetical protein